MANPGLFHLIERIRYVVVKANMEVSEEDKLHDEELLGQMS